MRRALVPAVLTLVSAMSKKLLSERGLEVDHTTIWRWVQRYGPELEERLRRHLKAINRSWRVDETYVRVKGRRWCADAGRPTRFKPSSPSPTDAVRDGSAKLGHPVQNVTREHGLTPLPR